VWEDLHWADPSTLEVLSLFMDQAPTVRILTVLTYRPEFQPLWPSRSYLTPLTLTRLALPHVEQLVLHVTSGKPLPPEVSEHIVAKTDGVPLFVEELTKTVLESGAISDAGNHYTLTGSLPALAIPTTLHDSLMARLDRLAAAKGVAQLGAAIGRQFAYDLLRAVSQLDDATLRRELGRLVEAELLYQRGLSPLATYTFKHALIQDAAYQSLLKSTRQQYHQQIAQVLTAHFPETVEIQPELLAHHYTEAGLLTQAVDAWQQAGLRADTRSAHAEAIAHFTRALDVLQTMPETPQHTQRAIELHTALGWSLQAIKGYTASEAERAYTRALELCQQIGEIPHRVLVLLGLWAFRVVRAELPLAHALGEQLLTLAPHAPDTPVPALAHMALGFTLFHLGELVAARNHLSQGVALYSDPAPLVATTYVGGVQDPKMLCLSHMARALWLLGYPDQALQQSQEALAHAQTLAHPFTILQALAKSIAIHRWRGEGSKVHEQIEATITLATEQGITHIVATSTFERGLWLLRHGQTDAGSVQVQQGLTAYRAMGAGIELPYMLARLAETYGSIGQPAEGLTVLAEALALVEATGERWWEAELYRLQGELLLAQEGTQHSVAEVEACMQKALDITRHQQAKSLELRATMSLSQLWQQQGRRVEAHQLLTETYGWFTEGFDTADMQQARALLDAL
jgi:predicted ATPase